MTNKPFIFSLSAGLISLLFAVALFGCKDDGTSSSYSEANVPIIQNSSDNFTLSLEANNCTSIYFFGLTFSTDTIRCSLEVTNYASGNAIIIVGNTLAGEVHRDTIVTNGKVITNISDNGIPTNCTVICNTFTGKINYACFQNRPGRL